MSRLLFAFALFSSSLAFAQDRRVPDSYVIDSIEAHLFYPTSDQFDPVDSDYWYDWDPKKDDCPDALKRTANVTVSKVIDAGATSYPEYDRLVADGRIDVIVFCGRVSHLADGPLQADDYGYSMADQMASALTTAGFKKAVAPKGMRYTRTTKSLLTKGPLEVVVDFYTPSEFEGLADSAHIDNFAQAVRTHEIVVYNGHSLLGASDFWARPSIYDGVSATKYQMFLYDGCLGFEYYVSPILTGKMGWDNVDIVSNSLETPFAVMITEAATLISSVVSGAEKNGNVSWQTILTKMNTYSGDQAYYGAAGVRTNKFHPPVQ